MPSRNELLSIFDHALIQPALAAGVFPQTMLSGTYWSSTTHPKLTQYAFSAYFAYGAILYETKTYSQYGLVRAGRRRGLGEQRSEGLARDRELAMTPPEEQLDSIRQLLGHEQADGLIRNVLNDVSKTRVLEGLLESRRREALLECTSAVEKDGGVPTELLEALGQDGLRLVARVAEDYSSPKSFRETLQLVELAIKEGLIMGSRRVLEKLLERRFGLLTQYWILALYAADLHDLNGCYERLATASSAQEVLDPLVSKLFDNAADQV